MLRAAYDMFRTHGYAGTTMDAIAKTAGVAVQTLYFTFRTKAAILDETIGAAVTGFEVWEPPSGGLATVDLSDPDVLRQYHPWYSDIESAPVRRGLEIFIESGVEIMERAAPLTTIIPTTGDPETKLIAETGRQRRYDAFSIAIRLLAKKRPGLRAGLTARRATDILFAVFSDELYMTLRDRGWKARDIRVFLVDTLAGQLLASG